MASLVISIKGVGITSMRQDSSAGREAIREIVNHLQSLASGNENGTVYAHSSASDPVAASATITVAAADADDTVTIGKTVLTAKASPSTEAQWSQAGTDTEDAASLVAKINAHSVLSLLVSAANEAGVVTVTSLIRGAVANHIALVSSNGVRLAVTGSGYLASGTGGSENTAMIYAFGQ